MSDAILTTIDPNDNGRARYQYRVDEWLLLRRCLPPAEIGDRWHDDAIDEPWWEPVLELPPGGEIREHWDLHANHDACASHEYAFQAQHMAGHVVAYAPSGREVRWDRSGQLVVQPRNDNYWITVPDLQAAREAYYQPERWR